MEESDIAGIPREGESVEDLLNSVDKELQEEKTEEKAETSEEKPAESQTEKTVEKLDLPVESILKKNSAWEEMRTAREQAERRASELETKLSALEKGDATPEKSEFIRSIVGENEEVAQKWEEEKGNLKEQMKRELAQEQIDAETKQRQEHERWTKWTEDKLAEVEKEFHVDFKTDESKKNELSKIMLDYSPTDEAGNLDYIKGMKILTEINKVKTVEETQKTQVKKNIADATVSKETSVKQNKGFLTSHDLRGKDWRSIATED